MTRAKVFVFKPAFLWLSALLVVSCSPVRKLQSDQYLVTKSKIIEKTKFSNPEDNIKDYVFLKPNKKFLGIIRFNLQVYNIINQEKMRARRTELDMKRDQKNIALKAAGKKRRIMSSGTLAERMMKFAEPPAILDTNKVVKSVQNMAGYLFNEGYFDVTIRDSIVLKKRQRAAVYYIVNRKQPYTYRNITYSAPTAYMKELIEKNKKYSEIKSGQNFNLAKLDAERERLSKIFRRSSYFYFNKEYIEFDVDTTIGNHQLDVTVNVVNPDFKLFLGVDTVKVSQHRPCKIRNIYIDTEYALNKKELFTDTAFYKNYIFPYTNELKYKPGVLIKCILLEKGNFFNVEDHEKTYSFLSNLRNFKFVNIEYEYAGSQDYYDLLDCKIQLTPSAHQSFGVDGQGTTTGSYPGIEANFVYQNRNAFHGAEIFEFRIYAKAESQVVSAQVQGNNRPIFNTIEFGGNLSIRTPIFLVPFNIGKYSKRNRPQSFIRMGIAYQSRPDYQRLLSNISFGYEWNETVEKKHYYNPIELNIIRVSKSASFEDFLNITNDQFTRNSFTSQIISNTSYTYTYSNVVPNKRGNYQSFKGNFQLGGNLFYLGALASRLPKDDQGRYQLANMPFAQYARVEGDFRNFFVINPKNTLAVRALVGIGLPYGNSTVMPFEKSFSAGGANDIRGWIARRIGPGSFANNSALKVIDQFGDIKILGTLEYRVNVFKQLELAVFADAGNIWLMRKDKDRTGGEFDIKNVWKQFALSGGIGIRLNLGFFVFRLDPSIPLYDPSQDTGSKWVVQNVTYKRVIWNLAIGYPF